VVQEQQAVQAVLVHQVPKAVLEEKVAKDHKDQLALVAELVVQVVPEEAVAQAVLVELAEQEVKAAAVAAVAQVVLAEQEVKAVKDLKDQQVPREVQVILVGMTMKH
jgi:hypothetical protein